MPEQNELDKTETVTKTPKRVEGLLSWVRLFLPVAIAAIGWYVGHTVGGINDDITRLEERVAEREIACAAQIASNTAEFENIKITVQALQSSDIRDHTNIIEKDDYLRDKARIEADIKDLEAAHKRQ